MPLKRRARRLGHRLQALAVRGAVAATGALPPRTENRLFGALARVAYRGLRVRRDVVEGNLRVAFPDRPDAWIRETAEACYAHLGREMMVGLRIGGMSREEIVARTELSGLPALQQTLADGGGAVIFAGHFGNWEMAGAALASRGVPLDVVAQRQRNRALDAMITGAREHTGMRIIDRTKAPRQALRSLRSGRAVGFLADQDARRSGVFVPFFGRLASTHRGPAILALRAGAPVFIVLAARVGEGYQVSLERVEVDREGGTDDVVRRITAAATARLEAAVRRRPEQYLWLHKRWKTRPRPGDVPSAGAGGPPAQEQATERPV